MAIELQLLDVDASRRRVTRRYRVVPSGSYSTGGDTFDVNADMTNDLGLVGAKWGRKPTGFAVENVPIGYVAHIVPGDDLDDWKIAFTESDDAVDPLDEIGATTYPVALSGSDDIHITLSGPIGV